MGIITAIIGFFLSALALKLALAAMGARPKLNGYSKALWIAGLLSVCSWLLGFIPFVGWAVYGVMWVAVIMGAYKTSFFKSLGVAILQVALRFLLLLLMGALF